MYSRSHPRPRQPVEPSRLSLRDLVSESLAGILQRPARTGLTTLGTILGVGAFTAILGLTATTAGQISSDFTVLAATQVTVKDAGTPSVAQNAQATLDDFPPDADQRIQQLNGVVHAGVYWQVFSQPPHISAQPDATDQDSQQLPVYAASPGMLQATDPTLESGVLYNTFHDTRHMRVAVLGAAAAAELGVTNLGAQPAVFINGAPYTVVGILANVQRNPELLLSVIIPDQTAQDAYGLPKQNLPAAMLIETRLGAAPLIAHQAPLALRPDQPTTLQSVPPPDPHQLQDAVSSSLNSLFLLLASITLLIGAIGIANTTLVAVMERTGEIGLRRALGARPRHIAAQFLTESTVLGTLGGLIGTAGGIAITIGTAITHHWTAVLNPATTLPAPLIGTLTGLSAGLYPALRAAHVEPLEALRR